MVFWVDRQSQEYRHADIDLSAITYGLHSTSNRIKLTVESQGKFSVGGEL